MGYSTDSIKWPMAVPSSVVQLHDLLFSLVDERSECTGERLAQQVFTSDGVFMAASGVFDGFQAIRGCRKGVWDAVTSRHHVIHKAFACDADKEMLDLVLVGTVEIENSDGHKHTTEFIARSLVVQHESSYRVKHYQVLIPTPKAPQPIIV